MFGFFSFWKVASAGFTYNTTHRGQLLFIFSIFLFFRLFPMVWTLSLPTMLSAIAVLLLLINCKLQDQCSLYSFLSLQLSGYHTSSYIRDKQCESSMLRWRANLKCFKAAHLKFNFNKYQYHAWHGWYKHGRFTVLLTSDHPWYSSWEETQVNSVILKYWLTWFENHHIQWLRIQYSPVWGLQVSLSKSPWN